MTDQEITRKRGEAFTTSMVDLFGCGFIAAVFLFLANMMQPLIDAEQASAYAAQPKGGAGVAGPAILIIENHDLKQIEVTGLPFDSIQDQLTVIPDSAAIRWPVRFAFRGENAEPSTKRFQLVIGGRAVTVVFSGWSTRDSTKWTKFEILKSLRPRIIQADNAEVLAVELIPPRHATGAFRSSFHVIADNLSRTVVGWQGEIAQVKIQIEDRELAVSEKPNGDVCGLRVLKNERVEISCAERAVYTVSEFTQQALTGALLVTCDSEEVHGRSPCLEEDF